MNHTNLSRLLFGWNYKTFEYSTKSLLAMICYFKVDITVLRSVGWDGWIVVQAAKKYPPRDDSLVRSAYSRSRENIVNFEGVL